MNSGNTQQTVFTPWENASQEPLVRFENVTKRFGDFTAIDKLSLSIYEREFFSLLGPSGCGKTTLMRMLAGFELPSEGRIFLDGVDLSNMPPHQRPVNMMFQSYALFPHMNVAQNIAFGLKQDKRPASEVDARVEEMLNLVQLQKFAQRKPHQLSGGQRQRVALARSLAKKPKLLLLDEPLGALDKKLREETQFELMNIQEQLGLTFIIVTHDQDEAMTVSSRIAVMDEGQLIQVSEPAVLYERPESRYVADFVGDVNIIEGRVTKFSKSEVQFDWAQDQPKLSVVSDKKPQLGSTAWLAVRPEKIAISKTKPKGMENAIRGIVWDIGYTGSFSTYHVKMEDGSIIKAREANRRQLANREITWEDNVWLSWKSSAGIYLDH